MIRLVSVDDVHPFVADQVCRRLFMAYGIGCEDAGVHAPPEAARTADGYDAIRFVAEAPPVHAFGDDRTVFVTRERLHFPEGPLGEPPADGFSDASTGVAVVSTHGLTRPSSPLSPESEDAWTDYADKVARRAVQQVGFLWGLHRCLDARCAMYVPWSPAVADAGSEANASLCDFCREKSETRLRRTRS